MDIQRKAFESSNSVNPDWSFKFDEELQQYIALDSEMELQVDEFNEHWDTFRAGWQAAKAQAVPEGFVLVEKKEFEQMQEFEDLYRRAIFNSKKSIHEVNWSHVSNLGVGSTRAKAMCKRFNIDPEATFRKPQEPTND